MINNGKELFALLNKLFEPQGYIKKKDTWYLNTPDCICFFRIGKSEFGEHFDHIMGCFLKEIHQEEFEFPKYNKSDLKYSLREMADKNLVKIAFDFENSKFINDEREVLISDLVQSYAIPFLKDVSTKGGIKMAMNKYEDLKYSTKGRLREYLGIWE